MKDKIYCVLANGEDLDNVKIMTTDLLKALTYIVKHKARPNEIPFEYDAEHSKYTQMDLIIFYDDDSYTQLLPYLNPSQFMLGISSLHDPDLSKEAQNILSPYIEDFLESEKLRAQRAENKKREEELKLLAELKKKYEVG